MAAEVESVEKKTYEELEREVIELRAKLAKSEKIVSDIKQAAIAARGQLRRIEQVAV